jgi:hypothetical protein
VVRSPCAKTCTFGAVVWVVQIRVPSQLAARIRKMWRCVMTCTARPAEHPAIRDAPEQHHHDNPDADIWPDTVCLCRRGFGIPSESRLKGLEIMTMRPK